MPTITDNNKQQWTVLSGLFFIYMASNGIVMHTLPLLYPELIDSFGWTEAEVTLPATVFFRDWRNYFTSCGMDSGSFLSKGYHFNR